MRRYFPMVPLVAGTVAPQSLEEYGPVADRAVRLDETVHGDPSGGVHDDVAETVADRLGSLAPQLLAHSSLVKSKTDVSWRYSTAKC